MRIAALLPLALAACQAEPPADNSQPANNMGETPDAAAVGAAPRTHSVSGLELIPLEIRSGTKTHRFTVEVARSPEEQAQGLMFRGSLGDQEGMLFPMSPPRPASFWMKNTLIPLDMIFVRADGSIARIAAMTTPRSLEAVGVTEPVAAVLELRGGRAGELGIGESARVSWPGGPPPA